ncbi:MAG: hypothetical protein WBC05_00565 [Sedimentisphaerales bacterium]
MTVIVAINDTVAVLATSVTGINAENLNKRALKLRARATEANSYSQQQQALYLNKAHSPFD